MTLYHVAMRDELDFDVQALKYVNIGRSRHVGAEAGLTLAVANASVFVNAALQDASTRLGDNAGKQLKAIPGQVWTTGVTWSPPRVGTATLSATRLADMFIDDANTRSIPSWTRVDVQVSRRIGYPEVVLGARNLLDRRYSSTGFLDPSGSGEAYFYPAAGRVITLGVRNAR
jgi:outer membrane receptor protein involved in Fe transport